MVNPSVFCRKICWPGGESWPGASISPWNFIRTKSVKMNCKGMILMRTCGAINSNMRAVVYVIMYIFKLVTISHCVSLIYKFLLHKIHALEHMAKLSRQGVHWLNLWNVVRRSLQVSAVDLWRNLSESLKTNIAVCWHSVLCLAWQCLSSQCSSTLYRSRSTQHMLTNNIKINTTNAYP